MDNEMIKKIGMIIGGFVVFIIILFLLSKCSGGGHASYENLVSKMIKVTKEYYSQAENKKKLPLADKGTTTYKLKDMINDGKIKEISEYFDDENMKCEGYVTVTNNSNEEDVQHYSYTPYLKCSTTSDVDEDKKSYITKTLRDAILDVDEYKTDISQGSGLYEVNQNGKTTYQFRGLVENNYVSIGNDTYRILQINDDNSIRLIKTTNILKEQAWDTRYNVNQISQAGINEYFNNNINSDIKEALQENYEDKEKWPELLKGYILTQTLCIGTRKTTDTKLDNSIECSKTLENQMLGALTVSEYLQASIDPDCTSSDSQSCRNVNWLTSAMPKISWSITADAETTHKVFKLSGTAYLSQAANPTNVYPVFNLSDLAVLSSGEGTEEDPYIIYGLTKDDLKVK